jgi:hypothetical protein
VLLLSLLPFLVNDTFRRRMPDGVSLETEMVSRAHLQVSWGVNFELDLLGLVVHESLQLVETVDWQN